MYTKKSAIEDLYNFGLTVGAKLENIDTLMYKLNFAIKKGDKFDFLHYFLTEVFSTNRVIPHGVSNHLIRLLADEEEINTLYPFVMGIANAKFLSHDC